MADICRAYCGRIDLDYYVELDGYEDWTQQSDIASDYPLVFSYETLSAMIEDPDAFHEISEETIEFLKDLLENYDCDFYFFHRD